MSGVLETLKPTAGRGSCIAFCLATGIVGLVISMMMNSKISAFHLPMIKHGWDADVKAAACRKAALAYIGLAVFLFISPLFMPRIAGAGRVVSNAAFSTVKRALPKEKHGLLGYTRKRSDLSDSDVELN